MARWLLYAILSFGLNIFLWLTCWLWALIPAAFRLTDLPGPLWYLQTHDNWVYGHGWPKPDVPPTFLQRWKIATWWIARNPGYAFDAYMLGFPASQIASAVGVPPEPGGERGGQHYSFTLKDGSKRFGYRRNVYLGKRFYIKIWLGWHYRALDGKTHMLKIAFGPKFVKRD